MGYPIYRSYSDEKILFQNLLTIYKNEIKKSTREKQFSLIKTFLEENDITPKELIEIIRSFGDGADSSLIRWGTFSVYMWAGVAVGASLGRFLGYTVTFDQVIILSWMSIAVYLGLRIWGYKQYKYYRNITDLLFEFSIRPNLKKDHVVPYGEKSSWSFK